MDNRKRYQVFISSTFIDLVDERSKVMETILNFDCFPAGMELFPAMDEEQFEYIKKIIDDSDYYLLIIGGCYGSMDDSGVSWTEREYDYAVSKGIHVMAFDHKDFTKLPADKTDQNNGKRKKLVAFKKKVLKERLIRKWTNSDDLALAVAKSLPKVLEQHPGKGWVRANLIANGDAQKEIDRLKEQIKTLETELEKSKTSSVTIMTKPRAQTEIITIPGTNVLFNMVRVEGGTFMMGASEGDTEAFEDEKPAHRVLLNDYYIGETVVTQALWNAVMGTAPSKFKGNHSLPVESVSWNECQEFIKKLNNMTGLTFRLPTEAEWEFAARGGKKNQGYKFSGSNYIDDVAWYDDNSGKKTNPVKCKKANELGLFDMSGNVWEWCQDWKGNYCSCEQCNPQGPSTGSERVLRGGSWFNSEGYCRVSHRHRYNPDESTKNLGFRLVLSQ